MGEKGNMWFQMLYRSKPWDEVIIYSALSIRHNQTNINDHAKAITIPLIFPWKQNMQNLKEPRFFNYYPASTNCCRITYAHWKSWSMVETCYCTSQTATHRPVLLWWDSNKVERRPVKKSPPYKQHIAVDEPSSPSQPWKSHNKEQTWKLRVVYS